MPLRLALDADRAVQIGCLLEYRAEEPYSVRMTFQTGVRDPQWVIARDLIAEGLTRPSGDGDVIVWPEDEGDDHLVVIALSSPTGEAVVETSRDLVAAFLDRTYKIVPLGEESSMLDVDELIKAILTEGMAGR